MHGLKGCTVCALCLCGILLVCYYRNFRECAIVLVLAMISALLYAASYTLVYVTAAILVHKKNSVYKYITVCAANILYTDFI